MLEGRWHKKWWNFLYELRMSNSNCHFWPPKPHIECKNPLFLFNTFPDVNILNNNGNIETTTTGDLMGTGGGGGGGWLCWTASGDLTYIPIASLLWCKAFLHQCLGLHSQTQRKSDQWSKNIEQYSIETENAKTLKFKYQLHFKMNLELCRNRI